ncbi:MAG: DUF1800 family protein [Actinomycetota bacterium]
MSGLALGAASAAITACDPSTIFPGGNPGGGGGTGSTTSTTLPEPIPPTVPPPTAPPTSAPPLPPTTAAPSTTSTTAAPSTSTTGAPSTSTTVAPTPSSTVAPPTTSTTVAPTPSSTVAPPTTSTTVAPTPSSTVAPPTTSTTTTTTAPPTTSTTVAPTPSSTVAPPTTTPTTAPETTTTTAAETTTTTAPETTTTTEAPGPPTIGGQKELLALTRLTFGAAPGQMAAVNGMGADAFIEDQLSKTGPDPDAERYLANFPLFGLPTRKEIILANRAQDSRAGVQVRMVYEEMCLSNILRAVYSKHQLYEMMCHTWMDHFNVKMADAGHAGHQVSYQEFVIRRHAMGSFRELLKATAHSPAMMQYLDNATSNFNKGVNENYGRELLELHSLGIHHDGSQVYTEDDVRAASLVMTGWTLQYADTADRWDFRFFAGAHGGGPQTLLNGQWNSGSLQGKAKGDSLLEFLATHESTARYVAARLITRFVDDAPRPDLIASTAKVYLDNDTQIVPVLRHIFASRQFAQSAGRKLRRPFEIMAAMMRASGAQLPTDPHSDEAVALREILMDFGHAPWEWSTPDGYPDTAAHWLLAASVVGRWNLGARVASGDLDGVVVNANRFRVDSSTVGELIAAMARDFAIGELPRSQVTALARALDAQVNDPAANVDGAELTRLAGLLFAHPAFQVR